MPFIGAVSGGSGPAVMSGTAVLDRQFASLAVAASEVSDPLIIVGCTRVTVLVNITAGTNPPTIRLEVSPNGSPTFGPYRSVILEAMAAVNTPYYRSVNIAGQVVRLTITNQAGAPDALSGSYTIMAMGGS